MRQTVFLDNWFGDDLVRAVGNVAEHSFNVVKDSAGMVIQGNIVGAAANLTRANVVSLADVALNGQKRKDIANEVEAERNKAREILRKETALYEAAQRKKSDAEAATKSANEELAAKQADEEKAAKESQKTMYWMLGGGAGFLIVVLIILYFVLKKK